MKNSESSKSIHKNVYIKDDVLLKVLSELISKGIVYVNLEEVEE